MSNKYNLNFVGYDQTIYKSKLDNYDNSSEDHLNHIIKCYQKGNSIDYTRV